jgi:hypothetical protein
MPLARSQPKRGCRAAALPHALVRLHFQCRAGAGAGVMGRLLQHEGSR